MKYSSATSMAGTAPAMLAQWLVGAQARSHHLMRPLLRQLFVVTVGRKNLPTHYSGAKLASGY